jgi:hypothetical protein
MGSKAYARKRRAGLWNFSPALKGEAITRQPEHDDVVIDQPYSLRIIRPSVSISRYARAPINYSQPLIGRRIAARGLRDGYIWD